MRRLLCPPRFPLRTPPTGAVALPLSIVVDMVEVSGFGEGDRMLRVEDSLEFGMGYLMKVRMIRTSKRLLSVAKAIRWMVVRLISAMSTQ